MKIFRATNEPMRAMHFNLVAPTAELVLQKTNLFCCLPVEQWMAIVIPANLTFSKPETTMRPSSV